MRGMHRMRSFMFFMFSGGRRHMTEAQKQRIARVDAAAEWLKLPVTPRKEADDTNTFGAGFDTAGSRPLHDMGRAGIPEQSQIDRTDAGGIQYPAGSSGGTATVTGWYFWADDRLYQGFQTWDALQAGLEEAIGNAPKKISEVKYHE